MLLNWYGLDRVTGIIKIIEKIAESREKAHEKQKDQAHNMLIISIISTQYSISE